MDAMLNGIRNSLCALALLLALYSQPVLAAEPTAEPTKATTTDSGAVAEPPASATDTGAEEVAEEQPVCAQDLIKSKVVAYFKPEAIKRIQQQLRDAGYPLKRVDGRVGSETKRELAQLCEDFQIEAADNIAHELAERLQAMSRIYPTGWRRLVQSDAFKQWLAQKTDDEKAPKLQPLQVTGGNCGCSRDFKAKVYGFYPYWLASSVPQQIEERQLLDFSLYDRISYFKLDIDPGGDIGNDLHWDDKYQIADFIYLAHKHSVMVDLTLQAEGWKGWSGETLNNAAFNIVNKTTQTYQSRKAPWWVTLLRRVRGASTVRADGLTLFFENYADPADSEWLAEIIRQVADRLEQADADIRLNLMLSLDWGKIDKLFQELRLGPQEKTCRPFAPPSLECMLLDERIEHVLVYLDEDTSASKKLLRQTIENAYHGYARREVLKKILPIVAPRSEESTPDQFKDDLIYFEYNFAGVALWPIPLAAADADAAGMLEQALLDLYPSDSSGSLVAGYIDGAAPWLCRFVCPNRWPFRIASGLLGLLLVLYLFVVLWNCRLSDLNRRYFVYFVAVCFLTAMILLVSFVCDPFWREWAEYVLIGLLLLLLVGIIWRYVRKALQPPLP